MQRGEALGEERQPAEFRRVLGPHGLTRGLSAMTFNASRTSIEEISRTWISTPMSSSVASITATKSAYSAVVSAEDESARRTIVSHLGITGDPSASFSADMTSLEMISSATISTPALRPVASVEATTGASTLPGPFMTSSASSTPDTSTSTSVAHETIGGDGGGTPLDVSQQGAAVSKWSGSLLGLAIAFVVVLFF